MTATGRIEQVFRENFAFNVFDEGPIDGEPIVLLHGFPERSTCWRDVAPILHAAGYRTIAMDQRGYSPQARPRWRRDYRIPELVRDIKALLDVVPGGSAHVVAHDWGSMAAWMTAIQHPGSVRTLTATSVPHPAAFYGSLVRSAQFFKSWYILAFQVPVLPERLGRNGTMERLLRNGGMDDEALRRFREEIVEDDTLHTALMWYRALPWNDLRIAKDPVRVPTTLVWSTDDKFIGRASIDLCEKHVLAPYELVILDGVSHWVPTEAPDALAEAILERVQSVPGATA